MTPELLVLAPLLGWALLSQTNVVENVLGAILFAFVAIFIMAEAVLNGAW